MNEKRMVRSRTERMCMGVAGGIAEYLNIDATLVRLFFVLTTIFSSGLGLLLYGVLSMIMPNDNISEDLKSV